MCGPRCAERVPVRQRRVASTDILGDVDAVSPAEISPRQVPRRPFPLLLLRTQLNLRHLDLVVNPPNTPRSAHVRPCPAHPVPRLPPPWPPHRNVHRVLPPPHLLLMAQPRQPPPRPQSRSFLHEPWHRHRRGLFRRIHRRRDVRRRHRVPRGPHFRPARHRPSVLQVPRVRLCPYGRRRQRQHPLIGSLRRRRLSQICPGRRPLRRDMDVPPRVLPPVRGGGVAAGRRRLLPGAG
mmetsp:Transcript_21556/g.36998  ORF Transcript_21556/g.36998 Transcript_21556/m.36998 type:complete len:236 (+) Transcript_21556:301-1008(+)